MAVEEQIMDVMATIEIPLHMLESARVTPDEAGGAE